MKKQVYHKNMDMDKNMDKDKDMDMDKGMNKSMSNKEIQLFVKSINNKTFSFFINNNDTILHVKELIKNRTNIKIDEQRLVYAAKELINENTIQDYNIHKESTLHLACKNLGGSTQKSNRYA